jgi:hypothetical protein
MEGMKANAETTAVHLEKYIGTILKENNLVAKFCAYVMEATFGSKIHDQVHGFITFAQDPENGLTEHDIQATLCHDLSGGLNRDKMMLPRVSEYGTKN